MVDPKKYPNISKVIAGFSQEQDDYAILAEDFPYWADGLINSEFSRLQIALDQDIGRLASELQHWDQSGPRANEVSPNEYEEAKERLDKLEKIRKEIQNVKYKIILV